MPHREHDTCRETPEAKEETHEQRKKEDYHPPKRRKTHAQVWGAPLTTWRVAGRRVVTASSSPPRPPSPCASPPPSSSLCPWCEISWREPSSSIPRPHYVPWQQPGARRGASPTPPSVPWRGPIASSSMNYYSWRKYALEAIIKLLFTSLYIMVNVYYSC